MARKSSSGGVGRGNGSGSAKTQFQSGMPSGNPTGRPRKPKPHSRSLSNALTAALNEMVYITENGVSKRVPQSDAMAKLLLAGFAKATTHGRISILRYIQSIAPDAGDTAFEPSQDAVDTFIAGLIDGNGLEVDEHNQVYDPNDPSDPVTRRLNFQSSQANE